jgi:tetratricopeptide (TPR) repeat protein
MPKKLLIGRTQILLLALSCIILLAACSRDPNVRKQKYYDSATELAKKGKVAEAALQLQNALKIDSNFAEAASALAELQFRQGNYGEAFKRLRQAETAKPDYLPARKGLAQLYRRGGRLAEAQSETEYVLEHAPDDIDSLMNLGAIQAAQKKPVEAEGTFNRILELQPNHVAALLALASVRKDAKDLPGAERYLKLALEKNPRSSAVYLSLIRFYIIANKGSELEPLFAQALKATNNRLEILEAQAGYYEGLKKYAEAEEVVRKIQSSHAGDPHFWGTLADFYVRTSAWTKAKSELERILQQHRDDPSIVHRLIEVHLNLNDRKSAEALNEALLKKNSKDSYGHLFKGRIYLNDRETDKALMEFTQTQKFQPNLPALHYWYAQAYLQRGQLGLAKDALETALKYDPGYRTARLQLAQVQNQTGTADSALTNARQLMESSPGDVQPMLVYSQALIAKRDYTQAEKVLKAVSMLAPQSVDLHRQLGVLFLVNNNLPAARKEFEQAWRLAPDSPSLLQDVVMGYVAAKQTDAAIDFVQKQLQTRSQDALLYHQLAQLYLLREQRAQAISALQKALSLAPAALDSAILLADVYATGKQPEPAKQVIAQILQKYPQNPDALLPAGMIFEKIQQWDEARAVYERLVKLDNGNALAKNNLAWLLVNRGGNIDVALSLAQQAKEKLNDDPQVTDTIGWIYYKKSLYKTALNYLKECAQRDQKNPLFQYHLGLAYWKVGENDAARRSLENALKLDPHSLYAESAHSALHGL